MAITHRVDVAELHDILRAPNGAVARDVRRRSTRVQNRARQLVGVDTGLLRSRITVELVIDDGAPVGRVGSNVAYALVHHEGHGEIRPVRGRFLRFRVRGSRRWVFTKRVRPVRGNPYLRDALPAARD